MTLEETLRFREKIVQSSITPLTLDEAYEIVFTALLVLFDELVESKRNVR